MRRRAQTYIHGLPSQRTTAQTDPGSHWWFARCTCCNLPGAYDVWGSLAGPVVVCQGHNDLGDSLARRVGLCRGHDCLNGLLAGLIVNCRGVNDLGVRSLDMM